MSTYYIHPYSLSPLPKLLRNSSLKYCSWHLLAAVVTLRCVVKASVMYTYNTVSCLLECNQATDSVDCRAKVCNTQWQQGCTSKGMPEMCSFIECSWLAVQWLQPDLTIIYTHTHKKNYWWQRNWVAARGGPMTVRIGKTGHWWKLKSWRKEDSCKKPFWSLQ